MDNFEKVEKLREKTGVTYEEAKRALDACDYDMLDAVIYLEKLGKVAAPTTSSYTTTPDNAPSQEFARAQKTYEEDCNRTSASDAFNSFFDWCRRAIKKGCETSFNVVKEGKKLMSIPVIILVFALILLMPITVILLIVGLFCDCKYYFEGFNTTVDINDLCDKASEACTNAKNDIQGNK
ncbi:MAG: DUF4342 domain-containing protein [Lachnospiraceae bacterium]|nr:DUF4342 domain-containing protein [Lachnospiraceae bacterium]